MTNQVKLTQTFKFDEEPVKSIAQVKIYSFHMKPQNEESYLTIKADGTIESFDLERIKALAEKDLIIQALLHMYECGQRGITKV